MIVATSLLQLVVCSLVRTTCTKLVVENKLYYTCWNNLLTSCYQDETGYGENTVKHDKPAFKTFLNSPTRKYEGQVSVIQL